MMRRIIVIVLVAFLAACSSIDCPLSNYVGTTYLLMNADGTADSMKADTMWIWTTRQDGDDTLLVNALCHSGSEARFSLPVSYTQPEDVFYTVMADTLGRYWLDTIRIQKNDIAHFESVECNAIYFHEVTGASVTHHAFDSIVVNNPHVNYETSDDHFLLYRKAQR